MNHERGERVIRSKRVAASDILKIKSKPIRCPNTRLHRAAIALLGPDSSVRATDMDFDHPRIRRVPTYGCLPYDRVACNGNGIRIGGQGWSNGRTRCIDGSCTNIPLKHIRARICLVLNIYPTARRVIQGHLDRRIPNNEISTEKVTLYPRREKDTIRVSENGIPRLCSRYLSQPESPHRSLNPDPRTHFRLSGSHGAGCRWHRPVIYRHRDWRGFRFERRRCSR